MEIFMNKIFLKIHYYNLQLKDGFFKKTVLSFFNGFLGFKMAKCEKTVYFRNFL